MYCHFELERFPASEFYKDEEGRDVHRVQPLHTVDGHILDVTHFHVPQR
jgi:hypothetical protein